MECKICENNFHESKDRVVACEHQGMVHLGCCTSNCSQHGAPCDHGLALYRKLKTFKK